MSDIMSDMSAAIFTARDLSRKTAAVLKAAARLGSVRIRTRAGKSFSLRAEPEKPGAAVALPDFAARRRAAGMERMTAEQERLLDKLIGSE